MTETPSLPFGPGALIVVGVYVLSLLGIGAFAYSQRRENSLHDFFLAGRCVDSPNVQVTLESAL